MLLVNFENKNIRMFQDKQNFDATIFEGWL